MGFDDDGVDDSFGNAGALREGFGDQIMSIVNKRRTFTLCCASGSVCGNQCVNHITQVVIQ